MGTHQYWLPHWSVHACPYPVIHSANRGPKSRAGLIAYPALVPQAIPMATTTRPMTTGARLDSGGVALTEVMAKMRNTRIAVPMIWSRSAPNSCTGAVPLPGSVEKMPWVFKVWPGSVLWMTSV